MVIMEALEVGEEELQPSIPHITTPEQGQTEILPVVVGAVLQRVQIIPEQLL